MPAKSPEEICRLFQQYMRDGDLDAVLGLYDPEAVFLNQAGEAKKGEELRRELAPFAAEKAAFDFQIKQVIQAGEIALMHTEWKVSSPRRMTVYAIEVARRQPDGTWRWLVGDPYTVGRHAAS
jgi:ketosteroid isomerase-like protein